MPKVLLVEDDNNLREIFQMRLQAEGYVTVVAADGEEGLVAAMKERPDLVIADVMMPKLSGFEMVESLRAAPETKSTKIIMMTALGQAEDQARGEKLGVVKYLVKSQVTLEDFARVVKETLGPGDPNAVAAAQDEASNNNQPESEKPMQPEDPSTNPAPAPSEPSAAPAASEPSVNPVSGDAPADNSVSTDQQSTAQEEAVVTDQVNQFAGSPPAADAPATDSAPAAPPADMPPAPAPDAPAAAPTDPAAPTSDPTSNAL
jgi:CheY-like chemotaxis protein